jgi:kumamolisin
VPDVSANADPDTGYIIDYTSNVNGYSTLTFYGGTSFVAPQLNGVMALLGQIANQRLSLLNFPLYSLLRSQLDQQIPGAPLRYITEGDNWFYHGEDSYSPAAGLGVIDAAKLAAAPGFR